MKRFLLAAALSVSACAHGGADKGEAGAQLALPAGCQANLTGLWEHEGSMTFRYEAQDDGQKLKLIPHRVNADGTPMDDDAKVQEMEISMARKPEGFTGDFKMMQTTDTGDRCGVLFAARITACAPDRMTLQVEQSYAVNESCQRIDMGGSDTAEHVLVRLKKP